MSETLTQADFSRRTGIAATTIWRATKKDLAPAVTEDGRIDPEHPVALAFAIKHSRLQTEYDAGARQRPGMASVFRGPDPDAEDVLAAMPENIREVAHWPLIDVIKTFGTADAMKDFLEAIKSIEVIIQKRLANAKEEGDLVSRELVMRGVIEPFNSVHTRLMTDGARVIARQCFAMAAAGKTEKEGEKYVSERISAFIRAAKARAEKAVGI